MMGCSVLYHRHPSHHEKSLQMLFLSFSGPQKDQMAIPNKWKTVKRCNVFK